MIIVGWIRGPTKPNHTYKICYWSFIFLVIKGEQWTQRQSLISLGVVTLLEYYNNNMKWTTGVVFVKKKFGL